MVTLKFSTPSIQPTQSWWENWYERFLWCWGAGHLWTGKVDVTDDGEVVIHQWDRCMRCGKPNPRYIDSIRH